MELVYGAEAAATRYFGLQDTPKATAAQQLDIAQAATLAGIPSNPTLRNPIAYPKNSIVRTQQVLQQMYVQGYITAQQKTAAIEEIQSVQALLSQPICLQKRHQPMLIM